MNLSPWFWCILCGVWLNSLGVGVMFEDLIDPLRVVGHIDEDARLVGPSAAPAMDTHSNNNLDLSVLAHERAAVIPLQWRRKQIAHFFPASVAKERLSLLFTSFDRV